MSAPMARTAHPRDALAAHVSREQQAKPVPPQLHRFVTQIDAPLEQEILDVRRLSGDLT